MDKLLALGDRIKCKDNRDLRNWALRLSSEGYGVAILGCDDIFDHVLTVTALPIGEGENG